MPKKPQIISNIVQMPCRAGGSILRVVQPNFKAVLAENSDAQCVKTLRLLGGSGGMPPPPHGNF